MITHLYIVLLWLCKRKTELLWNPMIYGIFYRSKVLNRSDSIYYVKEKIYRASFSNKSDVIFPAGIVPFPVVNQRMKK